MGRKIRTLVALAFALASATASVFACESGGPADPAADASVEAAPSPFTEQAMRGAADAFNEKYCEAFERCDPIAFQITFGGRVRCKSAGGLVAIPAGEERYLDDVAAPYAFGSKLTPESLRRCASDLRFDSCTDWVRFKIEHVIPATCTDAFFGALATRSPCGAWNQCMSGRCIAPVDPSGGCGVCEDLLRVGQRCTGQRCEAGAACSGGICVRYADKDDTCDKLTRPCHPELRCDRGKCVAPTNDECESDCSAFPSHRGCDPLSKKCVDINPASIDGGCGDVEPTWLGIVRCAHELTCLLDPNNSDGGTAKRCAPVIDEGAVCGPTPAIDNHCREPDSRCYRDRCQRNGPVECTQPQAVQ